MKYKKTIYTLVLMGVSLTMSVLASAKGLQYSEENQNALSSFILKVQERPDIGGKGIYSYDSELAREPKLFRESRSSDTDTKSYSDFLGPSFDTPHSVDGHSQRQGPWWDGRSSGDPSVKGLSSMDGGGFAPLGAYSGSQRRP